MKSDEFRSIQMKLDAKKEYEISNFFRTNLTLQNLINLLILTLNF